MRNDLLSIEGIASAELDGNEDAPQGVRVQLAAGADADAVGREVQRVLASHGMRSHRAADQPPPQPPPQAPPQEPSAPEEAVATGMPEPGPPPPPGAEEGGGAVVRLPGVLHPEIETSSVPFVAEPAPAPATGQPSPVALESVSVEESRQGVAVRVTAGERSVTRQVGSTSDGMDAAIVGALAELLGLDVELIAVQRGEAGEARIVTVLLEVVGEGRQVGSAVIDAGEAFAVGQAAWRALTAPE